MGMSFVLYSAGSLIVYVFNNPTIVLISVVLWAFAEILLMPSLQAHLADNTSPENRVVLFSLNAVAMGIGEGAGSFIGARLTINQSTPSTNAFLVCAVLAAGLAAALFFMKKRSKPI